MFSRPAVAIFIVMVAEYFAAAQVASAFGFANMLLSLVGLSVLGLFVLRWKAAGLLLSTLESFGVDSRRSEVVDRVLGLLAGLLLVIPGFVTAAFGLLLLLAPVRRAVEPFVLARTTGWTVPFVMRTGARVRWSTDETVIDVDVVEPESNNASRPARPEIG